jgi:tRNA A-37 threonylcarbamoyl transferase component Bud32
VVQSFHQAKQEPDFQKKQDAFEKIRKLLVGEFQIGGSHQKLDNDQPQREVLLKRIGLEQAREEPNPVVKMTKLIKSLNPLNRSLLENPADAKPSFSSLFADAAICYARVKTALDESTSLQISSDGPNALHIERNPDSEKEYTLSKNLASEALSAAVSILPNDEKEKLAFQKLKNKVDALPGYQEIMARITEKSQALLAQYPVTDHKQLFFLCAKIERQKQLWIENQMSASYDNEYHKYKINQQIPLKRKKQFPFGFQVHNGMVTLNLQNKEGGLKNKFEEGAFKVIYNVLSYAELKPSVVAETTLSDVHDVHHSYLKPLDLEKLITRRCSEKEEIVLRDLSGIAGPQVYGYLHYRDPRTRQEISSILMKKYPLDLLKWINMCSEPGSASKMIMNLENNIKLKKHFSITMLQEIKHFHEKGWVHLDIKPENFLLDMDGEKPRVLVIDFGFSAKPKEELFYFPVGEYQPPENLIGKKKYVPTGQSDVWSLALVLYCLWKEDEAPIVKQIREAQESIITRKINEIQKTASVRTSFLNIERSLFPDGKPANSRSIEYVLWHMLKINPAERISLDEALRMIHDIADDEEKDSLLKSS